MSLDYLEDLEQALDSGHVYYACSGQGQNQWHVSSCIKDLRDKAQRAAKAKHYPVTIYRLVNRSEAFATDSYLIVRKISPTTSRTGEPLLQWALVDTKDAAEMLRDVSFGPSPYFGAVIEEIHAPDNVDEANK